jgi:hypothetical protein
MNVRDICRQYYPVEPLAARQGGVPSRFMVRSSPPFHLCLLDHEVVQRVAHGALASVIALTIVVIAARTATTSGRMKFPQDAGGRISASSPERS